MKKNKTFDTRSWVLIVVAFILAVFAFIAPKLLTVQGCFDFTNTGQIGDTIGGITSPFIGLASIMVMFLAFYMQFRANQMMQSQFEINQFNNQFFEMLKTHKENYNTITSTYLESSARESVYQDPDSGELFVKKSKGFEYFVMQINYRYNNRKRQKQGQEPIDIFKSAYEDTWEDSFGHYYRHLFMMVKSVVSKPDDFLPYKQKRYYLRILRASLSTYEQVALYYNWLSDYGKPWENDDNHFFTDYRMIHNIVPSKILTDFKIKDMPPFKELLTKDDTLFEHQEDILKQE